MTPQDAVRRLTELANERDLPVVASSMSLQSEDSPWQKIPPRFRGQPEDGDQFVDVMIANSHAIVWWDGYVLSVLVVGPEQAQIRKLWDKVAAQNNGEDEESD